MMRVVIFGATGQLGVDLVEELRSLADVQPIGHEQVDICDAIRVADALAAASPDWVVNLAAFHVLEECERQFERALAVNAAAVRSMAMACRSIGARFMTVSTDYVFSGDRRSPYEEDASTCPLQAYGITKLAGELGALGVYPAGTFVVRSCGLYGRGGSKSRGENFVVRRLAEAKGGKSVEVGSDLVCTPTSTADLAIAMRNLISRGNAESGIYHLTNEGECNWAEFTAAAFEFAGCEAPVVPVDRKGAYGIVRRPRYSVLANIKAKAMGISLPHWRLALQRYIMGGSTSAG